MGQAALAIAVPMAVGLASGHLAPGVLAGVGGLLATMADRTGPYLMRVRRVAAAAVFGGVAGLLIGTAINGRGWVAVPVMIAVAGVSALLSSVGAVWSAAGLRRSCHAGGQDHHGPVPSHPRRARRRRAGRCRPLEQANCR
jgi:hypothetical protein